jgi:hypothetical protein
LYRGNGSGLCRGRNPCRTGSRRFKRRDPIFKPPDAVAGFQRQDQGRDGDDRYRQDQKYQK